MMWDKTRHKQHMTSKTTQIKTTRAVRPPSLKRQALTLPSKIQQPVRPPKWISSCHHTTQMHTLSSPTTQTTIASSVIGRVNNSPTMQFFTGISRNTQLSYICHHWLSVSRISKIMHWWTFINMPYYFRLDRIFGKITKHSLILGRPWFVSN